MAYHLLIVGDDELVQSLLAAYMKRECYKVSYAGTGKEMLATLNAEKNDGGARSVTRPKEGQDVTLTNAQFNPLAALAKAPNRELSRDYLLDAVSRNDNAPSDRLIDVLTSRVRKRSKTSRRSKKLLSPWPTAAISSRKPTEPRLTRHGANLKEAGDYGWHR